MNQFLSWFGKKAANGIATGIFIILTIASVAYALTYSWNDPTSIRNRTVGSPLTSTGWNLLVGNMDNLNERVTNAEATIISQATIISSMNTTISTLSPSWAVMAFNLTTCPTGWSPADGTGGRPDLRGEFIRGLDNGRGIDSGRTLGSWEVDMFKSHQHAQATNNGIASSPGRETGNNIGQGIDYGDGVGPVYTDYTGGNETRPRNVALLYCIKN